MQVIFQLMRLICLKMKLRSKAGLYYHQFLPQLLILTVMKTYLKRGIVVRVFSFPNNRVSNHYIAIVSNLTRSDVESDSQEPVLGKSSKHHV